MLNPQTSTVKHSQGHGIVAASVWKNEKLTSDALTSKNNVPRGKRRTRFAADHESADGSTNCRESGKGRTSEEPHGRGETGLAPSMVEI
nr:hypothetical protein Iba_chr11bCG7870 [Ipomoea batatas]